ncbi:MAG: glycosyltransferase [Candidatus Aminicenantes bacterium]|nr:glycosyltransferase [Candidatus Aminicenantes bacterium]
MILKTLRNETDAAVLAAVAHIHHFFLPKSETFIYHIVTHLRLFHPVFVSWNYRNLEHFPIPPADRFSLSLPVGGWRWLRQGIGRRLLNRELGAERFLKQRRVELLHAHFGRNGVWALRLKRALGLPLVTTFYGHDMSRDVSLASCAAGYPLLFREGDLFLVEGPHMKERLAGLGCPEEKIAIQHIAIPLSDLPHRPRRPKEKKENTVILFSGRFIEKKGLLVALAALHAIRPDFPYFEFRIIGDGPLRAEIENFIQRHAMSSYVRMLGFLDYSAYLEQMSQADLFLHPSMTAADGDSEGGAPTTILEAQALGMPVLATRHADIPHVVLSGKSALLSAEGDVAALAENTARLLRDPGSWAAMGLAGRRHIEEHHDADREVPGLEARYAALIDRFSLHSHGR